MKKETVRSVTAKIAQLEAQQGHLALLIQFPPPGCRNVPVWRQVQSDALCSLKESLGLRREELTRMTGQLELDLHMG